MPHPAHTAHQQKADFSDYGFGLPYGFDFSTRGELIASSHSVEEIRAFIGLDTLCYLSLDGMLAATGLGNDHFCPACLNGEYPVQPRKGLSKLCLES